MKAVFEKLEELSEGKVEFFSVRLGDAGMTEFDLFDGKEFPNHAEELELLYLSINEMSERGAKLYYFHNEGPAEYMPVVDVGIKNRNNRDYGLRLYCVWISETRIILLNGGVKTKWKPEDCPNVSIHFSRAIKLASKLKKQMNNGDIDDLDQHEIDI